MLFFLAMQLCLSFSLLDGRYWQNNMNNVKANKSAHKESVRDLRYIVHWSMFLYTLLCYERLYDLLLQRSYSFGIQLFFTSFCRTDLKFCSCSDDTTVKVWDFARCQEEYSLSGNVLNFLAALRLYWLSHFFFWIIDALNLFLLSQFPCTLRHIVSRLVNFILEAFAFYLFREQGYLSCQISALTTLVLTNTNS